MSVIVTDLEMPKTCVECSHVDRFFCSCDLSDDSGEYSNWVNTKRHDDCPLKSVEGLIKRIEKTERYGTSNGHDIWLKTPEDMKRDIVKIIQEYCEVQEWADG